MSIVLAQVAGVAFARTVARVLLMDVSVHHDRAARRFRAEVDGYRCVLDYELSGDRMSIVHTGVPSEVGGRGVAASLTEAAVAAARSEGWTIAPLCSYARVWFERHPEHGDLLA
ncbi:GNAT family N-acetyltransferase [Tahibacter sp.]|uniref:GNAT family N-acetyltransferase n=1 Tax=Tahibacter sp. TaxID=2056211 RepID=UPI0028C40413|nr:GNAT family N-acetyltransferase [Tahibacter sp.]